MFGSLMLHLGKDAAAGINKSISFGADFLVATLCSTIVRLPNCGTLESERGSGGSGLREDADPKSGNPPGG